MQKHRHGEKQTEQTLILPRKISRLCAQYTSRCHVCSCFDVFYFVYCHNYGSCLVSCDLCDTCGHLETKVITNSAFSRHVCIVPGLAAVGEFCSGQVLFTLRLFDISINCIWVIISTQLNVTD